MKIIATLIHNGISYGIPEGTKVPEKPRAQCICDGNHCEEFEDDQPYSSHCKLRYQQALQALLSVSIQWEDQEDIMVMIEKNAHPTHYTKVEEGGIYPLEGVEAENVWQSKRKFDKSAEWVDETTDVITLDYSHHSRHVLRLIPQQNSEQRKIKSYSEVHGTYGVDEKKICEHLNTKSTGGSVPTPSDEEIKTKAKEIHRNTQYFEDKVIKSLIDIAKWTREQTIKK